jgi:DNA-binding NarL/FixJ family response regulator
VIRVVLVDDQALLRDGFRSLLAREPDVEVVGEAGDGAEAVEVVARTRPDVVLMDIRMPRLDGLTATRQVLARPSPPRVVVLTTYDTDEHLYEALRIGASGFLLKDVRAGQLVDAVRTVAAGEELYAPAVLRRIVAGYVERRSPPPEAAGAVFAALSERERDVAMLVARGLSNQEIAEQLVLSEATVKTHVNRILAKLGVRDRVQVVVLAYESGALAPGGPAVR